jgi:3-oxoacyl-[acyl-carrier-protein] synthase II
MRRVVVTGIGVVSPIGTGITAFFDGLRRARPGIDSIRSFDARTFPSGIAGEVRDLEIDSLDLPERERAALLRDRKSTYGLVAAREALADAFGDRPWKGSLQPGRVGTFIGAGLEVFHLEDAVPHYVDGRLNARSLLDEVMAAPLEARLQIPAHLGARCIARETGAQGPFSVNLSACAAGTQALGEAFQAIQEGLCDMVVAGGYDSMVNPLGVGGFCVLEALSRSNHLGAAASRPFDARRDGFVLGEGAGMCIVEELGVARSRGARIYAELLGYATTLDAFRVSDPAPDQAGAIAAMRTALQRSGLRPEDIGYINAHGTATRKNDPGETRAIRAVFGSAADRIPVSSTKSQIGHLIGASGAVEFIAGLFAIQEKTVPATINLTQPDPECDLDYVPIHPRSCDVRTFLSNSFGFGGQNATIVAGVPRE